MNHTPNRNPKRSLAAVFFGFALAAVLALLITPTPNAHAAPGVYSTPISFYSTLASVSNATVTTTNGTAFEIPQNQDFGILLSVTGSGLGTSNATASFNFTDGVSGRWTTGYPVAGTVACAGTTQQVAIIYVNKTNVVGCTQGRVDKTSTAQTNPVAFAAWIIKWPVGP